MMLTKTTRFIIGITIFLGIFPNLIFPQLSIQTLSTIRNGQLPQANEKQIPSYYSDMIVEYHYDGFVAGIRGEGFSSPDRGLKYDQISQRYLQFRWSWLDARIGNVYEIFGKGLILRGFELPGFIYESQTFRTQQRIIRDFDGAKLRLNPGPFSFTFLRGKTIDPLLPPSQENRRFGDLTGAETRISFPGAVTLGLAYLEHETTFKTDIATRFLSWNADNLLEKLGAADFSLDVYAEYANQGTNLFSKHRSSDPDALYLSGNIIWNSHGASVEYKDYNQFDFGINDPPPLVRENTELLLNRSTHVLNASAEKGYQIELFFSPLASTRIITNYSKARNDFSNTFQPLFQERYIGVEYYGDPWSLRFFLDNGQDDLVSELERFTTGFAPEYTFSTGTALGLDIQWQRIRRGSPPYFDYHFTNFYISLKLLDWHQFSLSLNSERSSDPDVTESVKYFTNTSIGWQPMSQINMQLFIGKRRGGTACDHGYCIEVLDFDGVEMRIETRW
ncbi:hypothetical protein JW960_21350 [candidate division KSB1 bacterium]|nr:hypothetical protein [candidate division KSB1 bacterium]